MKIDVLTLIEDALIGGRSGDMFFIYNNPLIFELFIQWKNKKENLKLYQGNDAKAFKGFLNESLKPRYKEEILEKAKKVLTYDDLFQFSKEG